MSEGDPAKGDMIGYSVNYGVWLCLGCIAKEPSFLDERYEVPAWMLTEIADLKAGEDREFCRVFHKPDHWKGHCFLCEKEMVGYRESHSPASLEQQNSREEK